MRPYCFGEPRRARRPGLLRQLWSAFRGRTASTMNPAGTNAEIHFTLKLTLIRHRKSLSSEAMQNWRAQSESDHRQTLASYADDYRGLSSNWVIDLYPARPTIRRSFPNDLGTSSDHQDTRIDCNRKLTEPPNYATALACLQWISRQGASSGQTGLTGKGGDRRPFDPFFHWSQLTGCRLQRTFPDPAALIADFIRYHQCVWCPLLAQSGRGRRRVSRQLSGVKRTPEFGCVAAANDPKRTFEVPPVG